MRRFLLAALPAAAMVLGHQHASDRGALIIRRDADTLVVDRFIRAADTLRGSVQVKGQPRIDYVVALGPDESVRSLVIGVFAPGAAPTAEPMQRVRVAVVGDTMVAETPAGVQRIATRAGAIPMFNNALALSELFLRRARAAGGTATIPYFAINGGTTLDVSIRPQGADTLVMTIAQQEQRFRVDATGRNLGGVLPAQNMVFGRLGPEAAAGLNVTLRDTASRRNPE